MTDKIQDAVRTVVIDFVVRLSPVREPVLFFGAVSAWVAAYHTSWVDTDAKKAFLLAVTLWGQRSLSQAAKTANERVQAAQDSVDPEVAKYVGAVEQQAIATAAQVVDLKLQLPVRPIRAT